MSVFPDVRKPLTPDLSLILEKRLQPAALSPKATLQVWANGFAFWNYQSRHFFSSVCCIPWFRSPMSW